PFLKIRKQASRFSKLPNFKEGNSRDVLCVSGSQHFDHYGPAPHRF
ncbi:hypothetical protein HMPREF0322_01008, partial [Desulfitobacterium hafniense DP7]